MFHVKQSRKRPDRLPAAGGRTPAALFSRWGLRGSRRVRHGLLGLRPPG